MGFLDIPRASIPASHVPPNQTAPEIAVAREGCGAAGVDYTRCRKPPTPWRMGKRSMSPWVLGFASLSPPPVNPLPWTPPMTVGKFVAWSLLLTLLAAVA